MFQMKTFSIISVAFICFGIYLLLTARYGTHYWTWGVFPHRHETTPAVRAWGRFLGVFMIAFGAAYQLVITIVFVHLTVVHAIIGAGLVAVVYAYYDWGATHGDDETDASPPILPTEAGVAQTEETPPGEHLYFNPTAAVDPKKIKTAIKLGDFYRSEGKNEEAMGAYQDALSADPSSPELRARIDQLKNK